MPAKSDVDGDLRAPREVIGTSLCELIEDDDRVVVLDADLGMSTRLEPVEQRHPDHLLQLGVAEQNAVGIATGLTYTGHRPVFVSMGMFSLALPWTQLRQAAYAGAPVVVVGTHPGVDMGPDGGTHQFLEDLALARAIPEMVVLTPCDSAQTRAALMWAVRQREHPVYVRVGRHPVRPLHATVEAFTPGQSELLLDGGDDVLLVTEGSTASLGLDAAALLAEHGVGVRVLHLSSLKPIDAAGLVAAATGARLTVTVENHSVIGGLGSAVAETLGPLAARHERIGTPDVFGSSGSGNELRAHFGLTPTAVTERVQQWMSDESAS